jgi:hypothetical protein
VKHSVRDVEGCVAVACFGVAGSPPRVGVRFLEAKDTISSTMSYW